MTRQEFEEKFLKEAMSWAGVKFLHNGRSRKFGIDCLGLIAVVYRNIGLSVPDGDGKVYKVDWALHIENERYLTGILANGIPVARDKIKVGDVAYFKVKSRYVTHGGLITSTTGQFISALNSRGVTVTNLSDKFWNDCYVGSIRLHVVLNVLGEHV